MLSEMNRPDNECSPGASQRGIGLARAPSVQGQAGGSSMLRAPSTLRLLGKSLRQFMDSSMHGSVNGSVHGRAAGRNGSSRRGTQYTPQSAAQGAEPAGPSTAAAAALPHGGEDRSGSGRPRPPRGPGGLGTSLAALSQQQAQAQQQQQQQALPFNGAASPAEDRSTSSAGGSEYLRPHIVVKRASLDNPFAAFGSPAAAVPSRTWQEMQSVLREAKSATPRRSRDDSTSGSAQTKVNIIKPL